MQQRREWLQHSAAVAAGLWAAGLWPQRALAAPPDWAAAFAAKDMAAAFQALGGLVPEESADVSLAAPTIAENGAVVPVSAATRAPQARRLLILVDKNPAVLAAAFELTDAVEPMVSTRVKMNQTAQVYAVALLADQRVLFARQEIKITLGGCGG
jgi:sulfur-oxidizing protein SoxY